MLKETTSISGAVQNIIGRVMNSAVRAGGFIKNALGNAFHLALKGATAFAGVVKGPVLAGLKMAGRLGVKALGSIAGMAGRITGVILSPVKMLVNGFTSMGKSIGGFAKSFLKIFSGLSIFALLKKGYEYIKGGMTDAVNAYVSADTRISGAINHLKSQLLTLQGSLASAFGPIIETVVPYLSVMVDWLITAANAAAQFIAALLGKNVYKKASASIAGTGAAADSAGKSVDKLNKKLGAYDELNVIDQDNGGGGGGGGGGGSTGGGITYEDVEISDAISDFAEMVKKAWENADFTDVGRIIGEKLAAALNSIPWDDVKALSAKFGRSFATFINGFISAEGLSEAIGRTIGESVNTVFSGLNAFVGNLEFGALGEFIADAMNTAIDTIVWSDIAKFIYTSANGIFKLVETWAGKFNFAGLGTAVKDVIVETLTHLDWDSARGAADNIGKGIADFLNEAITPESLGSIGTTLGEAINTAVSGIRTFRNNFDWSNLGSSIASSINNFFETTDLAVLGLTLGGLANGLMETLTTALQETQWADIGKEIVDGIRIFFSTFSLSQFGELLTSLMEAGAQLMEGILEGIVDWMKDIGTKIKKNILDPFIQKFKDTFGIASPSKEMKPLGQNIIEGVFEGIKNWMAGIGGWIKTNIFDKFNDAWEKLGGIAGKAIDFIANLTGWDKDKSFKDNITGMVSSFVNWVKESKFGSTVTGMISSFKDWAKGDKFSSTITNMISSFKDWAKGGNFSSTVTNMISSFKDWTKGSKFSSTVTNMVSSFKDWIKGGSFSSTVTNMISSFKDWIKGGSFSSTVTNMISSFKDWTKGSKFSSTVTNMISSFKSWMKGKGFNSVISGMTAKFQWVKDALTKSQKTINVTARYNSNDRPNARGGIYDANGGHHALPQYASGGSPSHGTVLVAGEAGPEILGHIGGRTEILNQSQMAAVMYSSVVAAVSPVLKYMNVCTNAIIANIANAVETLDYIANMPQVAYAGAPMHYVPDINRINGTISQSISIDSLADAVAKKISGNIQIDNVMNLDGKTVYRSMVEIDRATVRQTGRSGFGG